MTRTWLNLILLLVLPTFIASAGHAADPDNCLLCHQFRGLSRLDEDTARVHVYFVDPDYMHHLQGPHARLACTDCHVREEVSVIPHLPTTPVDCARTCHLAQPGGVAREFSHRNLAQILSESVHRPESLDQLEFTGGPLLDAGQSHCLYCHDEPVFRGAETWSRHLHPLSGGVFDRCESCHADQLTVDIVYYVQHIAARLQPARPTIETAQVCAVCHSDPLVRQSGNMHDAVASYLHSFHGKAAMLGEEGTPDCLGCHSHDRNVHSVLSQTDPASPVHPTRIADTCSTVDCHPGASADFGAAAVHLDLSAARGTLEFLIALGFIVLTMLTFGPSALLVVLELFQRVVGRESEDARMHRLVKEVTRHPVGRQRLIRFTVPQRVQHWVLAVLFILLAVTGFPMKFADTTWAREVISWFGGLENARRVHHLSGLGLVIGFAGHLGYVVYLVVRRGWATTPGGTPIGLVAALTQLPMWINRDDLKKLKELMLYLLFMRSEKPRFGKFSLKEKFEYIGVFWGSVILGVTGIMLWAEQFASHIVGGRALNFAMIFHTYEAFLAMIHVGILHIYGVILSPHVFPLSPAMITGTTPIDELAEGHAEFVEDVAKETGITVNKEQGRE